VSQYPESRRTLNTKVIGVVVTDLLDQQDELVRRLLLIVEFKFCRGGGCRFNQLTER
jgi:hypothetical protein